MGFYLGGKHEKSIDKAIEFLQGYLEKENVKLSKMHTVYFTLKYTMQHMLGGDADWRDALNEVKEEIQLDEQNFEEKLEEILNKFREEIKERIKRGELV